jgi:hypothetical protein
MDLSIIWQIVFSFETQDFYLFLVINISLALSLFFSLSTLYWVTLLCSQFSVIWRELLFDLHTNQYAFNYMPDTSPSFSLSPLLPVSAHTILRPNGTSFFVLIKDVHIQKVKLHTKITLAAIYFFIYLLFPFFFFLFSFTFLPCNSSVLFEYFRSGKAFALRQTVVIAGIYLRIFLH